jgi:hypothetical protein
MDTRIDRDIGVTARLQKSQRLLYSFEHCMQKILVVEDDQKTADLIRLYLERNG